MSKFDTHGGYFAPKDYMKVNEGGSHDENPNGGVQIGVDGQGIPNMLEEGEPVYKDYVYSDNIKASKKFLEANNIPSKYEGKLYSDIADALFEEAEERPNDPVSRNGLEAMLGRLANTQEEQKQDTERRKLERELKNLSPDELDALEQELMAMQQARAQEQAQPQEAQSVQPESMEQPVMEEQPQAEQVPVEQSQIMAGGGPLGEWLGQKSKTVQKVRKYLDEAKAEEARRRFEKRKKFENSQFYRYLDNIDNKYFGRGARGFLHPYYESPVYDYETGEYKLFAPELINSIMEQDTVEQQPVAPMACGGHIRKFDNGGPYYSGNSFKDFLNWLSSYKGSEKEGNITGLYAPDKAFDFGKYGDIKNLEASDEYKNFTESIINALRDGDPVEKDMAIQYLQAYNNAIPENARYKILDKEGNLTKDWIDQYRKVRTYQPGVGHLSGDFKAMVDAYKATKETPSATPTTGVGLSYPPNSGMEVSEYPSDAAEETLKWVNSQLGNNMPDVSPVSFADTDVTGKEKVPFLPTFPRYVGAIGSAILGLYNAAQKPDKYHDTRIRPYTPTGHIDLQNERYMSVDQNMIQNQMLAQGNATQRSLANSGLGPSTAAALLAADNNLTGNLGTGFLQSWQANNQQRNAVTAANNQAEAQRAQFDFTVDSARQRALQTAQMANAQNDLRLQLLNYQAEADKYNALSNQINAGLVALSGIGRENFVMNQINSNTALNGYRTIGNGVGAYFSNCGGFLKKYKK